MSGPYGLQSQEIYAGPPIGSGELTLAVYVLMFLLFFLRIRREAPIPQALNWSLVGASAACFLVAVLASIAQDEGEAWIAAVGMGCFSAVAAIVVRLFNFRPRNGAHG